MPFYRTGVLQDAYVRHEGVVEAETPEKALWAAMDQWKGRRDDVVLVETSRNDYDHADPLDISDIEELSAEEYAVELAENKKIAAMSAVDPATYREELLNLIAAIRKHEEGDEQDLGVLADLVEQRLSGKFEAV